MGWGGDDGLHVARTGTGTRLASAATTCAPSARGSNMTNCRLARPRPTPAVPTGCLRSPQQAPQPCPQPTGTAKSPRDARDTKTRASSAATLG